MARCALYDCSHIQSRRRVVSLRYQKQLQPTKLAHVQSITCMQKRTHRRHTSALGHGREKYHGEIRTHTHTHRFPPSSHDMMFSLKPAGEAHICTATIKTRRNTNKRELTQTRFTQVCSVPRVTSYSSE